jgi:hypothetical protein
MRSSNVNLTAFSGTPKGFIHFIATKKAQPQHFPQLFKKTDTAISLDVIRTLFKWTLARDFRQSWVHSDVNDTTLLIKVKFG